MSLRIVVIGLSITSSWGNGHATTYRSLLRALQARGHRLLFLECDQPWYAKQRDMPAPPFCRTHLYSDTADLRRRFAAQVRAADLVIVGSYVVDGVAVARWVLETAQGLTAFYDIDTPITMASLARGTCAYLSAELVPGFDLYLSFTGGPPLERLRRDFGAVRPRPLFCAVDAERYLPEPRPLRWDFGYMGTYAADRQAKLNTLLLRPAAELSAMRFVVAGPKYPPQIAWPANLDRFEHLGPAEHPRFYQSQRFTLNLTRADMVALGWSPSVRLFEAAACGTAIVSDRWKGLSDFFAPGSEILLADCSRDVVDILTNLSETERRRIGQAARVRVLECHTADDRVAQLEDYIAEALSPRKGRLAPAPQRALAGQQ